MYDIFKNTDVAIHNNNKKAGHGNACKPSSGEVEPGFLVLACPTIWPKWWVPGQWETLSQKQASDHAEFVLHVQSVVANGIFLNTDSYEGLKDEFNSLPSLQPWLICLFYWVDKYLDL